METTRVHGIPDGAVVEWAAQPASIATGVIGNATPVRRVGRVSHTRPDGTLCIYDADGIRAFVAPARCAVLAERAEAGWGNLADLDALDAANHATDLRDEHDDGSWRDRD